jgi:uncharacterized protein YbjT (DUF2867 family)
MILVVGASGELGGRVLRLLRARDEKVRALVRPATADSEVAATGAEVAHGDLTDPASLPAACQGIDTVIATATAIARRLSGAGGPSIKEVDEIGMAALVDAAQAAGVKRFVYLSYAGADVGLGSPLERAKLATERRLRSTSMRVVIVRPDAFQEIHLAPLGRFDMAAGKVAVFGKGDTKRRYVSTDDVALLVTALATEADPPELVEFGGPEAISRNEAIAAAERITGRPMKRQSMPRWAARAGMRVLDKPKDGLASVFATGLMQDTIPVTWDDQPLRARGIEPRPATDWLQQQATQKDV